MRISDWSSDVCSSDLPPSGDARAAPRLHIELRHVGARAAARIGHVEADSQGRAVLHLKIGVGEAGIGQAMAEGEKRLHALHRIPRSEEHTSELQSLMRSSYAVFCLKKKNIQNRKRQRTYKKKRRRRDMKE